MRLRKESEFHQFGYAITDGEGLERGCCPKPFKQKCHMLTRHCPWDVQTHRVESSNECSHQEERRTGGKRGRGDPQTTRAPDPENAQFRSSDLNQPDIQAKCQARRQQRLRLLCDNQRKDGKSSDIRLKQARSLESEAQETLRRPVAATLGT